MDVLAEEGGPYSGTVGMTGHVFGDQGNTRCVTYKKPAPGIQVDISEITPETGSVIDDFVDEPAQSLIDPFGRGMFLSAREQTLYLFQYPFRLMENV